METQAGLVGGAEPQEPKSRSRTVRVLRKVGIGAVGGVVIAAGIVMLVTPGPGVIVTLAGLAILGREFPSARRRLARLRRITTRQPGDTSSGS